MGRLEPLTSLALGRSPYDDVVDGEGDEDPHEPEKQYDATGRVINPETKRIHKDVIRAHNEVMLVIGVAEPEHQGVSAAELESARQYHEYESDTGKTLYHFGRVISVAGTWGIHGIRQRMLVYKECAGLPFLKLLARERANHSYLNLGFAGIPTFIGVELLSWSRSIQVVKDSSCVRAALAYIRFHLQIYVAMQRLDLIPASQWVPSLGFFVPFSPSSPFAALPPLESLNTSNIAAWIGKIAVNLAPWTAFYLAARSWEFINPPIRRQVLKYLPHPSPDPLAALSNFVANTARRQPFPESPTLGAADREIRHTHDPEPDSDVPAAMAPDGQAAGDAIPVGAIRRQGTFSSRGGEEYATDEEDSEMVNPTLISFDVDTTESTELPPPGAGVWSAELRPSFSGDARPQPKDAPRYIVNSLTSLPSLLGGQVITNSIVRILLSPLDMLTLRAVARAFARKRGLPCGDMFTVNLLDSLSPRVGLNLVLIESLRFLASCEIWVALTVVSQWLHVTEEEWKDIKKEEEAEAATSDAS
ncbi:Uu.00g092660.m01.CDS01 [Anthostomella pinea]|uniref:Uu.00g092660.m01.CDS01 n=1 Tax=Anthostomella pinea TaxID=933095 RepID=A0AAI8VPI0_9PEZI|nr:Uu.00g092660.m01.CDS01 [Anthostomella pinea]